jgi:hypothetical protein
LPGANNTRLGTKAQHLPFFNILASIALRDHSFEQTGNAAFERLIRVLVLDGQ